MSKGTTTKTAILEAGLTHAAVRGMDDLSIGTLSKSTGMSKSGLFAHFGSKEHLQLELLLPYLILDP